MLDVGANKHICYNKPQCEKRLSPCSTFKIPNSLIGLETGVVQDENHVFKWDGTRRPIEPWNQDHSLQSAISNSVVWYYQELAARVGEERMQKYLKAMHYGNEDISGGITKFWLQSSLQISANEQVDFLHRLYRDELPFSQRSMDIVKKMIILSETNKYIFRGKTGTGGGKEINGQPTAVLGWFVGYLVRKDNGKVYIFAVNMEGENGASGMRARGIAEAILKDMQPL
jgi:beta-lactamase class D